MYRIHPITEESCRPHCGKPVLILLADGTEMIGTMSRVEDGKLYLNEEPVRSPKSSSSGKKTKIQSVKATRRKVTKAQTAAIGSFAEPFDGFSPFEPAVGLGPLLVLDLFLIAALFVLI